MYQYFIIGLFLTTVYAKPGNLAIELTPASYGIGQSSAGYGGAYGTENGVGTVGTISNADNPSLAVSSLVSSLASPHTASAVQTVPIATSSQSRVDIISPQPLVQQIISSVPVNVPAGYLRYSVAGYGTGSGYDGNIGTGFSVPHGNHAAGRAGY